ncbi:MAG: hypothetical protein M5U12_37195 [Verrucomicrobia bacterium]|nr:hypothetical protein [Verrucomicrobiota bacterium]
MDSHGGRGSPSTRVVPGLKGRQDGRVFPQGPAEEFGDGVSREVIRGRAQAAGGDDQVGPSQRVTHGLLNGGRAIRDGHLALDHVAGIGKLAAEPLLVGVQDAAQHQFAPRIEDLEVQGGGSVRGTRAEGKPGAGRTGDWPRFRGPQASGVDDSDTMPVRWDVAGGRNIRWKTPVPGLSHASPIVWQDRVYVVAIGESP